MSTRINPPQPQSGPILFAVVGVIGSVFAIGGMVSLPVGSEPWLAGALGQLILLGGFAIIEGGWLWIQREVVISQDGIVIRRWIEAIRGQPGRAIPLGDEIHASITLENVRSLRIERKGTTEAVLTLGYWEPSHVRKLVDALRANGVPLTQYWVGSYPPDVS